jgi:hypothetical protein
MSRDAQLFIKRALLSGVLGSAMGAIAYATFLLFFGQTRGSVAWLPVALLLFGPPAFIFGAPITLTVMGLVVAPLTWPIRHLLVRHRYTSIVVLGIAGWLLGKGISVQWLRDGAPSVPYDPDGYAGPIFGLVCCATWAMMMPSTSRGLSTVTDVENDDFPSDLGAALPGLNDD